MRELILKICGALVPVAIFLLYISSLPESKLEVFNVNSKNNQRKRANMKRKYEDFLMSIYYVTQKIPFINAYAEKYTNKFQKMYILNDEDAYVQTCKLIGIQVILGCILPLPLWLYFKDTVIVFIMGIIIESLVTNAIVGDGYKFLEELVELPGDIVHTYNAVGNNMELAFRRLSSEGGMMAKYVDQMNTYLSKALLEDRDDVLEEYSKVASSRYLRLIFNYAYLTAKYGDYKDSDGVSLFSKNILAIQREIHAEYLKIKRIKIGIFGNLLLIMFSIVTIPLATKFVQDYFTFDGFEQVYVFVNSGIGYVAKVVSALFTLGCFYVYNKNVINYEIIEEAEKVNIEERLLLKYRWLDKFIGKVVPKEGTNRYKKQKELVILDSGYTSLKPLYLKRLIWGFVMLVLSTLLICTDIYKMRSTLVSDIYTGVDQTLMDTITLMSDSPEEYVEKSIENDKLVIKELNANYKEQYKSNWGEENKIYLVKTAIKQIGVDYGIYEEVAIARIIEKYDIIVNDNSIYLMIAIILSMTVLGYMYPLIEIYIRQFTNRGIVLHTEVVGCYTIVILLLKHPSSNVRMIVEWLKGFSSVFKTRLQICLDHMNENTIQNLGEDIDYKPFNRLVECILLAERGAKLDDAFSGIEQRHSFQEEEREILNDTIVKERVQLAEMLGGLSVAVTYALLVIVPMCYAILDMAVRLVGEYSM